jgi:hypothetical protein
MDEPTQPSPTPLPTLEESLASFLRHLEGGNTRPTTITAYRTDVAQFIRCA